MSVYSLEYHAMVTSPGPAGGESVTVTADKPAQEGFFHHLLDVVNPLQHLPVIGTIYRAITGEHIDPVERIAGDTLYGGMWGAITAIADVAFEGITGKSFEDTALALLKGDGNSAVAAAKVKTSPIAVSAALPGSELPSLPAGPDVGAFASALSAKGVDGQTASRALYAYRRAMGLSAQLPVFASAP